MTEQHKGGTRQSKVTKKNLDDFLFVVTEIPVMDKTDILVGKNYKTHQKSTSESIIVKKKFSSNPWKKIKEQKFRK